MSSLNLCVFEGRLTRDPETKNTSSGKTVTTFGVAVSDGYKDKVTGEWKDEPFFGDFVAWNGTGDFIAKWFKKGSPILVQCRAKLDQWTDKEGGKRSAVRFVVNNACFPVGSSKGDGQEEAKAKVQPKKGKSKAAPEDVVPEPELAEADQIPF